MHSKYTFLDIVRPNPPINVSLRGLDPYTLGLHYKVDAMLEFFPPGFEQDVWYQSQFDSLDVWHPLEIGFIDTNKSVNEANRNFTGLIPHAMYTVRIKMQSTTVS
jgi:hypothetical protein